MIIGKMIIPTATRLRLIFSASQVTGRIPCDSYRPHKYLRICKFDFFFGLADINVGIYDYIIRDIKIVENNKNGSDWCRYFIFLQSTPYNMKF